jgi:hypothetical protein
MPNHLSKEATFRHSGEGELPFNPNPDDSLALDCLNKLLKAKAVRKRRN